jgi:hypothetical protein
MNGGIFQHFQASIVIENSKCTSHGCRKCERFTDIQDNGGLFKTLKVLSILIFDPNHMHWPWKMEWNFPVIT